MVSAMFVPRAMVFEVTAGKSIACSVSHVQNLKSNTLSKFAFKTRQNRLVMLVGNRFRQSLLTHTRLWYLVNAKDQINGRLAAYIATILQGKTKPIWHPKTDVGDFVVVVNTKDIAFSGRKWDKKVYRHHTGYPGGFKETNALALHQKDPTRVLWRAVNGMLPKNNFRKIYMSRLFLFDGEDHPYAENIYAQLEAPASMPKRLDEYTKEEFENYPKLF